MPNYEETLLRELVHRFVDGDVAIKLLNDYNKASEEREPEDIFWALLTFLCEIPGVSKAIFDIIPFDWLYDSEDYVPCPAPGDYVSAYILDLLKVSRKADVKI